VSRPWRILMLVFNPVGKGTYWRALHLARHLVQHSHAVTLMAMAQRRHLRFATHVHEGVTVIETPDLLWGSLRSGWDLWESLMRILWLRRHDFDVVHAFEARPTVLLPALYLQTFRNIPLVMDWCDWFGSGGSVEERPNALMRAVLRPVETFFEERFRTRAVGTTVICSTLYNKAVALGVNPETILFLGNGANVDGLRPLDRNVCRATLGLPDDLLIVGYVGAMFQRDAQLMAAAFDRIHAALPSARLLLIGYANIPIETMVAAPEAVICTGVLNDETLNYYLATCDVCWLPLRDSGANRGRWPLKLSDYMAVGRPTVATSVGDVTNMVQTYAVGVIAHDTPEDLADNVLALLRDPVRSAEIDRTARKVAEVVFDWRLKAAMLEGFYDRVLAEHSKYS
jgi:glycosyltransferase involved in cell wall biosynthesis